ncbi:MAG: hemerythrin family protein [Sedimentisphaerales bacterium]|nr:hemerythrin family protein [Sedimentisphaerales bacterium]MBN2844053.1 hemerythrin family protein [Sedimentisphaerales bacterium]
MSIVPWSSVMSVGNKLIDSQHRFLLGVINEVYAGVIFGRSVEIFRNEYPKLLEYAHVHFTTEEAFMKAAGYDGLAEHRQKHEDLKSKLEQMGNRLSEFDEEPQAYLQICTFLNNWLTNHMMAEDQEYVESIAMLGNDTVDSLTSKYDLFPQSADLTT